MLTNDFEVSIMNLSDLNEIKSILESEFDNFWNYNIFKSELENQNSTYFIIKHNSQIIGFIGILTIFDTAEITNIVVKKAFRGKRYI